MKLEDVREEEVEVPRPVELQGEYPSPGDTAG